MGVHMKCRKEAPGKASQRMYCLSPDGKDENFARQTSEEPVFQVEETAHANGTAVREATAS